jgi:hypothetical protein
MAADQPRRTSASAEDDRNGVSKTTSPAASEADSWAAVLDLATVAARYPLLRNTL